MSSSKIKDVTAYLESLAPLAYQESYDNSGLLTGDPQADITGLLVTLDCTEAVVAEAVACGANLIIAHHPIIFSGLKRLTGKTYVERTIISAIRNNIAIYAAHTNLDNVYTGVNSKIAEKIGLVKTRILAPRKGTLSKLVTYIPQPHLEAVLDALYKAGAGQLGQYKNCSFQVAGTGTFEPTGAAKPFIGKPGQRESVDEIRIEVLFPSIRETAVMSALRSTHPYEEVAYYITHLDNVNQEAGAGMIGELPVPEEPISFLRRLKTNMNLPLVRHTPLLQNPIRTVALCGGSGSFLLQDAISQGADAYISADFKYHEFFDADGKILVADIGHYESEQFTKDLFQEVLSKKFPTFAINFSKTVTNPILYL